LQANQAKKSVEDTKRLKAEKDMRSKQERDRRVRELNSTNTKTFIDERKRLLFKHSQVTNSLQTISKEELELLKEENTKVNIGLNLIKDLLKF
jgi:phosphatidylinositol phospholipase C beta